MPKGIYIRTEKNKGHFPSEQARIKMSNAKKGNKNSLGKKNALGNKQSIKTKQILSEMAKSRIGKKSNHWRGGRTQRRKYIQIQSPNHPYKDKKGYVFEHRLVIEKYIGRVLLPTEVVHHINGNPSDNRIENLMLFASNGEHLKYHSKIFNRKDKSKCQK